MAILETSRGSIRVQVGDKSAWVAGEVFGKSPGSPDFQIYADSITTWDPPHENQSITPEEREAIIQEVCEYLRQLGRIPVVLS
jgi:hypothetical protein